MYWRSDRGREEIRVKSDKTLRDLKIIKNIHDVASLRDDLTRNRTR